MKQAVQQAVKRAVKRAVQRAVQRAAFIHALLAGGLAASLGPLAVGGTAAVASAQIGRITHRQFTWLAERRRELLEVLAGLPAAKQEAIAAALTENDESVPLLTLARAFAIAKGVEADATFRFRAGLQVCALPEVVSGPRYSAVAVTVYAPHQRLTGDLPMPGTVRFAVRVLDAEGEEVGRATIEEPTAIRDLREFRSSCEIPVGDWPPGLYRVCVDTILDGKGPRQQDLPLEVWFRVAAGFGERAGALRLDVEGSPFVQFVRGLDPLPRAILLGAAQYATRAWYGMPDPDPARAFADLLAAEAIRENIAKERFPLHGVTPWKGYSTIALPDGGDDVLILSLRSPPGGLPEPGSERWARLARRPLVLFMDRMPTWDHDGSRPSMPLTSLPSHLAARLETVGFDRPGDFQVVVVESPGRVRHLGAALAEILERLPEVFPADTGRLVLVGDGHGAVALASFAVERPGAVRGLVLVNSTGGLASPQLATLKDLPILIVPGHGDDDLANIAHMSVYAKNAGKTEGLEILDERRWPWSLALPLAARKIEAFAARVTGGITPAKTDAEAVPGDGAPRRSTVR